MVEIEDYFKKHGDITKDVPSLKLDFSWPDRPLNVPAIVVTALATSTLVSLMFRVMDYYRIRETAWELAQMLYRMDAFNLDPPGE